MHMPYCICQLAEMKAGAKPLHEKLSRSPEVKKHYTRSEYKFNKINYLHDESAFFSP